MSEIVIDIHTIDWTEGEHADLDFMALDGKTVNIAWGDGSKESVVGRRDYASGTLQWRRASHYYRSKDADYTITITADDDALVGFGGMAMFEQYTKRVDLSRCPSLQVFEYSACEGIHLDVSHNPNLERIVVREVTNEQLDFSANPKLEELHDIREEVKEAEDNHKDGMTITHEPKVKKTSQGKMPAQPVRRAAPVKVHGGMSDDEDQRFVDNLTNDINTALVTAKAKGGKIGPAEMADMTKLFIEKSAEVAKFCEEQKTKRAQIRAQTQVAIRQIDTVRDFLKDYLQRSFDERRHIFDKEFEVVDKCLATGDTQALAITLNSITNLAQSSPFKALADLGSVRKTLENKGTFDI